MSEASSAEHLQTFALLLIHNREPLTLPFLCVDGNQMRRLCEGAWWEIFYWATLRPINPASSILPLSLSNLPRFSSISSLTKSQRR